MDSIKFHLWIYVGQKYCTFITSLFSRPQRKIHGKQYLLLIDIFYSILINFTYEKFIYWDWLTQERR